jgi:type II secretory pathway pseudopilin PulG
MKVRSESTGPSGKCRVIFTAAFSLIEVLVAVVVVGTSAVAMFSGINTGFFTMQLARENLRATQIMLEKTETLRLYNWDQISKLNVIPIEENYDPYSTSTNSGIIYRGEVRIAAAPLSTSYSANLKLVTVTLNWTTGRLPRTRSFTTYITQNGLQAYIY